MSPNSAPSPLPTEPLSVPPPLSWSNCQDRPAGGRKGAAPHEASYMPSPWGHVPCSTRSPPAHLQTHPGPLPLGVGWVWQVGTSRKGGHQGSGAPAPSSHGSPRPRPPQATAPGALQGNLLTLLQAWGCEGSPVPLPGAPPGLCSSRSTARSSAPAHVGPCPPRCGRRLLPAPPTAVQRCWDPPVPLGAAGLPEGGPCTPPALKHGHGGCARAACSRTQAPR